MGIGVGIFLIALGAILTFALDWTVGGLDIKAVGWVLMAAGVAGLILFFYFWNRRRVPAAAGQPQLREVPRTYDRHPAAITALTSPSASPTDREGRRCILLTALR